MPQPTDSKLYESVKKRVYEKNPIHSAYRSATLVKEYKKEFARKYSEKTNPYVEKKKPKITDSGLQRWFAEKWTNQRGQVGYLYKSDVYRPNIRISPQTPITFEELTDIQILRARAEKRKRGRVSSFISKRNR